MVDHIGNRLRLRHEDRMTCLDVLDVRTNACCHLAQHPDGGEHRHVDGDLRVPRNAGGPCHAQGRSGIANLGQARSALTYTACGALRP